MHRLGGDYHIETRHLGGRNLDEQKLARDRDLLLAELERHPDDARSTYFLAQTYFAMGDLVNARAWYRRRAEMGGFDEEVYFSLFRIAEAMSMQGEPWPDVQDAFLRAWEFRPGRAEPLYMIARWYRRNQRFWLGYLFAASATKIPFPQDDTLLVDADVYTWRALDEQAVCASRVGSHIEAFVLCRQVLAMPDIPDGDRQRIAANRDVSVPSMVDAASTYPDQLVPALVAGSRTSDVAVSLLAGPDRHINEQALNSFLNCCTDIGLVGRFLLFDVGLREPDRSALHEQYPFVEIVDRAPLTGADTQFGHMSRMVEEPFWLHLGAGWRFFAPEQLIGRLVAVLDAEPGVYQVGVNFGDATELTGVCAPKNAILRGEGTGGYVVTDSPASGPAMFHRARMDAPAGLRTASLDEVLCLRGG